MYAKLELSLSPGRSSISVTIPTEPATAGLTTGGGAAAGALAGLPRGACQANAMASRGGRCWAQRRALGDHNSGRQVVGVCFNSMHLTTEACVHPAICNQALCMCASEACFSASVRLPDSEESCPNCAHPCRLFPKVDVICRPHPEQAAKVVLGQSGSPPTVLRPYALQ